MRERVSCLDAWGFERGGRGGNDLRKADGGCGIWGRHPPSLGVSHRLLGEISNRFAADAEDTLHIGSIGVNVFFDIDGLAHNIAEPNHLREKAMAKERFVRALWQLPFEFAFWLTNLKACSLHQSLDIFCRGRFPHHNPPTTPAAE